MASMSVGGIGSGMDINGIVNNLMSIERQPLDALSRKQADYNSTISAYGKLKSAVSDFGTAMSALASEDKFRLFKTTSSSESVLTATSGAGAGRGSYNINVSSLAESHKLASTTYANSDAVVGAGTLTLGVGSNSFSLTIDSSNNTLSGIRDAINNSSSNPGVTATLINEAAGSRLVLTSNDTGTSNALSVSATDADGNDTDTSGLSALAYQAAGVQNLSQVNAAKDAALTIDGFNVTSASNTVDSAIGGISLQLKTTGTSTVSVARDDDAIKKAVQGFADSYNALRAEIGKQSQGQLKGDSTLVRLESGLRGILNSTSSITGSSYSNLAEIGVALDKNGKMQVDSEALSHALNINFDSVSKLFGAPTEGFANRLDTLSQQFLASDGIIGAREEGLKNAVRSMDDQKLAMQTRLERVQKRLQAQYSAMDGLVGQLRATGSYLTGQLGALSK